MILPVIAISLGKFSKLNLVEIIGKINYSVQVLCDTDQMSTLTLAEF